MLFIQPFRANYYKRKLPYTQSPSCVLSVQPEADQNSSKSSPAPSERHNFCSECWKAAPAGNMKHSSCSSQVLAGFEDCTSDLCWFGPGAGNSPCPCCRNLHLWKLRLTAVIPNLIIFNGTASRVHYILWDLLESILSMDGALHKAVQGCVNTCSKPICQHWLLISKLSAILGGNLSFSECISD